MDLSRGNLPPRTRLPIGGAVIEVTDQSHTGCARFSSRYGLDALRLVNSEVGRDLKLRGVNARVAEPGHQPGRPHDEGVDITWVAPRLPSAPWVD